MKYILYKDFDEIKMTNEKNFNETIQNKNEIINFDDFKTFSQVIDYIKKYKEYFKGINVNDIIIKE